MATYDKAEDLRSARALRALDPSLLVVGHGPATPNPARAIDAAIARAARLMPEPASTPKPLSRQPPPSPMPTGCLS